MGMFATLKRPVTRVIPALVTLSVVLGAGISVCFAADPPGNAARGQQLYYATGCYQCHGTRGAGGAGPRLAPGPLPIEAFKLQLRHPRVRMPVYTAVVMSDADIADIYAYLLRIPHGKSAAEIPLLKGIAVVP
jgi:mono/diheme cytochrome c family protein